MSPEQSMQGSILIVDDTPDNLRLLATMLADRGYKVRPAPSGAHALATVGREIPDLILLDVMMPKMNGYEVCRTLKADERTHDIPVIFLSALHEVEDKVAAFDAGGVDFITKPFHEKEVMARVETHLKIRGLQKKLHAETARFKALAEATFEGILIHSDSRIIDVNPEASRLLNCREPQLIGTDLVDLVPADIHQLILSGQSVPFETVLICNDNSRIPVEIRSKNMLSEGVKVSVTAIRDITRQKQMEREREQLLQENTALKITMQDRYKFGAIIGRSPAMQKVYGLISKAAATDYPVVIYGESGTGKELVAKTIHELSSRKNGPFITVNCGAVTESIFEREFFGHRKGAFTDAVRDEPGYLDAANRGTLFLDEVGELPLAMQVKLLRVIESGDFTPVGDVTPVKADVRFVAATNRDLAEMIRQQQFRKDLFYRIQVIDIKIPPLRERREDIRLLMEHILALHGADDKLKSLPAKLREMLFSYEWPGNVRELINTIQRYLATDLVSLTGAMNGLSSGDLPPATGLHGAVESLEKEIIMQALQKTKWHRGKAADLLQIPRRSLQRKMYKYDLRQTG